MTQAEIAIIAARVVADLATLARVDPALAHARDVATREIVALHPGAVAVMDPTSPPDPGKHG